MNTYSAIPPDTATLSRALGEVDCPVLIENPFTLGLYSLITSADDYIHCRETTQRLMCFILKPFMCSCQYTTEGLSYSKVAHAHYGGHVPNCSQPSSASIGISLETVMMFSVWPVTQQFSSEMNLSSAHAPFLSMATNSNLPVITCGERGGGGHASATIWLCS